MEVTRDVVLVSDMNCACSDPDYGPALKIVRDGVNVDLNGFTISCSAGMEMECVVIDNRNDASIFGGTVENCKYYGIYVHGDRNTVHDVKVTNVVSWGAAMYVELDSSDNLIQNVTLEDNQFNVSRCTVLKETALC